MPRRGRVGVQNLLNRWLSVNHENVKIPEDDVQARLLSPPNSNLKPRPYPRKPGSPGKARPGKRASISGHELSARARAGGWMDGDNDNDASTVVTESTQGSQSLASRGKNGRKGKAARRSSAPPMLTAIEIVENPARRASLVLPTEPEEAAAAPARQKEDAPLDLLVAQERLPETVRGESTDAAPSFRSTLIAVSSAETSGVIFGAGEVAPDLVPSPQEERVWVGTGQSTGTDEFDAMALLSVLNESFRISTIERPPTRGAGRSKQRRLKLAVTGLNEQALKRKREMEVMSRIALSRPEE